MNDSLPNCCLILYEELRRIAPDGEWIELSVSEIAERSRFCERTVYNHLPILIKEGLMIKRRGVGRGNKSRYMMR